LASHENGFQTVLTSLNQPIGVWFGNSPANALGEAAFLVDDSRRNAKPRKLKKGEKPELDADGQPKVYWAVKDKPKMVNNVLDLSQQKRLGMYN